MEVGKKVVEAGLEMSSGVRSERQYLNDITRAPIFFWIGWLVVAYFALFILTFYVSPFLFGTRPYRPFFYARNGHHPPGLLHRRPVRHAGELPLDGEDALRLTGNVVGAIGI